jgi:hypothetical protein
VLTRQLEVTLGPGTADLGLRVGLHSGPVTAGVLRGDRARFQLFGDTVNTTARVESTGMRNKIHISHETAELLAGSGKGHWITSREEKVVAKGKGEMQTYFLDLRGESAKSTSSAGSDSCTGPAADDEMESLTVAVPRNGCATSKVADGEQSEMRTISAKQQRLVDWNAEVMARILREIIARRQASSVEVLVVSDEAKLKTLEDAKLCGDILAIEEVVEIVALPSFDAEAARNQEDPELIELGENVTEQLREYVAIISAMYQENPFHNFEHASHVITSTAKLLSRITAPDFTPTDDRWDCSWSGGRRCRFDFCWRCSRRSAGRCSWRGGDRCNSRWSRTTWWTTSRTTTRYLQPGTSKNAKVSRDNQQLRYVKHDKKKRKEMKRKRQ